MAGNLLADLFLTLASLTAVTLLPTAAAALGASDAPARSLGSVHWAQSGHSDAFTAVAAETLVFALFGRWIAGADPTKRRG